MPRKRAAKATKNTKANAKKTTEAVHETPKEVLEALLNDLDAQVPRLIESSAKKYMRECQKVVRLLPDKSSLHPDVVNMPFMDFISRGGAFPSVMQSLREEQLQPAADKENVADPTLELVTPALPTKTVSVVPSTRKRKARHLEMLELEMKSQSTGSPIDEKKVMQELLLSTMKEALARLPKRSQAQAEKAFEEAIRTKFGACFTWDSGQLTGTVEEGTTLLVTPAISHSATSNSIARSTRSNTRRKK